MSFFSTFVHVSICLTQGGFCYLFILLLLKFAGDWGILFFNFLFLQVIQGRLDSLAVATIKALTTVMHKSPAAKVTKVSVQANVVKDCVK